MKNLNQKKKAAPKEAVSKEIQSLRKQVNALSKTLANQAPAAVAGPNPVHRRKPKITQRKDGVFVEHAEVFFSPTALANYDVDDAGVNPGRSLLFNWLSQIAIAFEEYEFAYLRFRYFPRCATSQAGTIVLAFDPKSGDEKPNSYGVICTYHIRTQGPMWKELELEIPRDVLQTQGPRKFINVGDMISAPVVSLYDVGKLLIAREGGAPAGGICGDISVEYGVNLYVPASDPQSNVSAGWVNATGVISVAAPFGNTPMFSGMVIDDVVGTAVFLQNLIHNYDQNCYYMVWMNLQGTGISAMTVTATGSPTAHGQLIISNAILTIGPGSTTAQYHCRLSGSAGYLTHAITATTITESHWQIARVCNNQGF